MRQNSRNYRLNDFQRAATESYGYNDDANEIENAVFNNFSWEFFSICCLYVEKGV